MNPQCVFNVDVQRMVYTLEYTTILVYTDVGDPSMFTDDVYQ